MSVPRSLIPALLVSAALVAAVPSAGQDENDEIQFRNVLDNEPIEFDYKPDQTLTPAVKAFHRTAENPYSGDQQAVETGADLYSQYCKACHLEDGTGRIGPSLVDDEWLRPRTDTDKGKFEIIYAGGAGAMQAFGRRMTQDEILKVMAYLEELRARAD